LKASFSPAITNAKDERALDEVRVSALGKKGSIAELLKTLGGMSPDERKTNGPLFNGLRDRVDGRHCRREEAARRRRHSMCGCNPSASM
jgi:phenylalanyl-tRNA synthetase alpha chain